MLSLYYKSLTKHCGDIFSHQLSIPTARAAIVNHASRSIYFTLPNAFISQMSHIFSVLSTSYYLGDVS